MPEAAQALVFTASAFALWCIMLSVASLVTGRVIYSRIAESAFWCAVTIDMVALGVILAG